MEPSHHLTFGPFCLDVTHGRLWRGGQPIALCGTPPGPTRAVSGGRGSIGIGQSDSAPPHRGMEFSSTPMDRTMGLRDFAAVSKATMSQEVLAMFAR